MTGYAIPAKFQKIGLFGESENWKFDTRMERTISDSRDSQKGGHMTVKRGGLSLTHFELGELETTGFSSVMGRGQWRMTESDNRRTYMHAFPPLMKVILSRIPCQTYCTRGMRNET